MIHNNLEFHNVVEIEQPERWVRRFPAAVRNELSPLGRLVAQDAAGCEIRFVTESTHLRISLSAMASPLGPYEQHTQDIAVFNGPFFHSVHRIATSGVSHIQIPDIGAGQKLKYEALALARRHGFGFALDVWRICLGRYSAGFHGLDTYGYPVRAPQADEVPRRKWLAYGSSITNGAAPTAHHLSYVYHAARALGVDVLNQGLSGACHCEPAVADYFAARPDWDFATLELGVNMRGSFTAADFRARASSLIQKLTKIGKPVAIITIFPNSETGTASPNGKAEAEFCAILRDLVRQAGRPNLHLIEGAEILTDFGNLTKDLIHPSDYGHIQMGQNLAAKLKAFV